MAKNISRRTLIKAGIGLGAMSLLGSSLYLLPKSYLGRQITNTAQALLRDKQVQYLRQLVTGDNGTSRCIMWQAEEPMQEPHVLVRSSDGTVASYGAEQSFFQDDGSENYQYTAMIDRLQPDQRYDFAIEDVERQSEWHTLQTCSRQRGDFAMLIFPDSQSSDYSEWQQLVQGARQRHPETELYVNMGDLVDNGEDSSQWHAWFNGLEGLAEQVAFAPVMGNHECYDKNWQERLPHAYLNYFRVPENGSRNFDRYYYSFDYGQVHFIVLSTVENEVQAFKTGLMEEQLSWLERDLQAKQAAWTVVMMHRDVLQYRIAKRPERKEGFSEEGLIFMPIFEKYQVDVVFTAHLHTYRNRGHILAGQHRSEGPLYILTGVAGNVRYPNLWTDHALDEVVAPQPETDNYLAVQVGADELKISCYLPDGTRVDEIAVKHRDNLS